MEYNVHFCPFWGPRGSRCPQLSQTKLWTTLCNTTILDLFLDHVGIYVHSVQRLSVPSAGHDDNPARVTCLWSRCSNWRCRVGMSPEILELRNTSIAFCGPLKKLCLLGRRCSEMRLLHLWTKLSHAFMQEDFQTSVFLVQYAIAFLGVATIGAIITTCNVSPFVDFPLRFLRQISASPLLHLFHFPTKTMLGCGQLLSGELGPFLKSHTVGLVEGLRWWVFLLLFFYSWPNFYVTFKMKNIPHFLNLHHMSLRSLEDLLGFTWYFPHKGEVQQTVKGSPWVSAFHRLKRGRFKMEGACKSSQ